MDLIPRLRDALARERRTTNPGASSYAAVSTVLRAGERGTEVLLIRRQERERDPWSGHMAFPGGRRHDHDENLLATALRETREEVGLDLGGDGEFLGRLADVPAYARGAETGMLVTPFVFHLVREAPLVLDEREVREVIWAPVPELMSGQRSTVFPYAHGDRRYDLPAFDVEGRIVWGLTHRMLEDLFAAIRGSEP